MTHLLCGIPHFLPDMAEKSACRGILQVKGKWVQGALFGGSACLADFSDLKHPISQGGVPVSAVVTVGDSKRRVIKGSALPTNAFIG